MRCLMQALRSGVPEARQHADKRTWDGMPHPPALLPAFEVRSLQVPWLLPVLWRRGAIRKVPETAACLGVCWTSSDACPPNEAYCAHHTHTGYPCGSNLHQT